ncbi:hypothetical protein CDAR_263851 [Caerostris darwini]|uniref:Uncharacterized protein n=1 Tax=Caerostris darwini TaxID=1538125 RepID=A0AAV4RE47_9ARAC|nr:hypothetical protein CDAR_263851 [Caerostris darwini]
MILTQTLFSPTSSQSLTSSSLAVIPRSLPLGHTLSSFPKSPRPIFMPSKETKRMCSRRFCVTPASGGEHRWKSHTSQSLIFFFPGCNPPKPFTIVLPRNPLAQYLCHQKKRKGRKECVQEGFGVTRASGGEPRWKSHTRNFNRRRPAAT